MVRGLCILGLLASGMPEITPGFPVAEDTARPRTSCCCCGTAAVCTCACSRDDSAPAAPDSQPGMQFCGCTRPVENGTLIAASTLNKPQRTAERIAVADFHAAPNELNDIARLTHETGPPGDFDHLRTIVLLT